MNPQIAQTVEFLKQRSRQLDEIAHDLQALFSTSPLTPPVTTKPNVQPAVAFKARVKAAKPRSNGAAAAHRPRQVMLRTGTLEALEKARTLKEPFDTADLSEAVGNSFKAAGNLITRWKSKGWIVNSAFGEYQRTKSFGGDYLQKAAMLDQIHKEIKVPGVDDSD